MIDNMQISKLGERQLIKRLLKKRDSTLSIADKNILESYHDDAAIQENTAKYTVLSTDMLIEKTHFPKQMSYFQIGQKVVTVNVSDIIAMNAKPTSILISMALPKTLEVSQFDELVDGILYNCKKYDISLIGGDLNESDEIILTGTATGIINKNIKLQSNIQEGNLVAVTGQLGTPAAGLDLLMNNTKTILSKEDKNNLINSILEPTLPINISNLLRQHPDIITSMTDITDGLAIELSHLQEKNKNIGFEIYSDKIPYDKNIKIVADENNKSLNEYLFHFGEEFELLLTLNKPEYEKYKDELNLYIIGKANNTNKITLADNDNVKEIKIKGYEHIKED